MVALKYNGERGRTVNVFHSQAKYLKPQKSKKVADHDNNKNGNESDYRYHCCYFGSLGTLCGMDG